MSRLFACIVKDLACCMYVAFGLLSRKIPRLRSADIIYFIRSSFRQYSHHSHLIFSPHRHFFRNALSQYIHVAGSSTWTSGSGVFIGGGPPIFGGGGGTFFVTGAKSSSWDFCTPSLKYSSKAEFGETAFRGFLAVLGGPEADGIGAAGGGDDRDAGTSKSVDLDCEVLWYSEVPDGYALRLADDGLPSSLLKRAVSNKVSPGPAGGSVNGTGRRCRAPKPNTQPRAPVPPQLRDGVIVTRRVTAYSWL